MLTDRQQQIWNYLVEYVDRHGYPPTVREIGEEVGLASPSTVHAHLANLERAGLLRRDPTKPRALELIGRERAGRPGPPTAGRRVRSPPARRRDRRRRAAPRRAEHRGLHDVPELDRRRLPAPRPRRLDDRGRHPRRRPRDRAADPGGAQRRDRRRASPATTSRPTRRRSRPSTARTAASASSRRTPPLEPIYADYVQILGKVVGVFREL